MKVFYFSYNICLTVFSDMRIVRFFAASAAYFDGWLSFFFKNGLTKRNGML